MKQVEKAPFAGTSSRKRSPSAPSSNSQPRSRGAGAGDALMPGPVAGGNLPRQVRGRACTERSMQCEGFRTSRRGGRLTATGLRPRLRGSNSSGQRSMPMRSSRDAAMQGLAGLRARRVGELEASAQRIFPHAHAYLCVRCGWACERASITATVGSVGVLLAAGRHLFTIIGNLCNPGAPQRARVLWVWGHIRTSSGCHGRISMLSRRISIRC